jgi:2-dehydropantoate 2-reductase
MRFVVYGAGAIGGVVGARLFQHGHEVVLIARGAHHDALKAQGLRVQDVSGEQCLLIPTVDHPAKVTWRRDDVVLVAVKSQHSQQVLTELAATAPPEVAVVCLQNGVRNEPEALRRFGNVYGVPVACPAAHLQTGVVQAYSWPVTGILDIGRYPAGVDDTAKAIAAAFSAATFSSRAILDITRWKWRKLVTNLGNAVEAVCGPLARQGSLRQRATAEGETCLAMAGIDAATVEEDRARRDDLLRRHPLDGETKPGGSSWQSLARRAPGIETDYLTGEIVLLGRLHHVATPVNVLLQYLANHIAATGGQPGSITPEEFDSLLISHQPAP